MGIYAKSIFACLHVSNFHQEESGMKTIKRTDAYRENGEGALGIYY